MAKTLLERAKEVPTNKRVIASFNEEELELVSAWMNDEITLSQIVAALKIKGTGNVYAFLARGARELYRNGGTK